MRYVIVGNSTAGLSAAEAIRSIDKRGEVTVVSDEPYQAYSRPLITYWLSGKADNAMMHYKGGTFYKDLNVNLMLGKKAVKIDAKKKRLHLEDGTSLPYDKLLLATGGTPIVPPLKGGDLKGVFTFTQWDDAKKVKDYLGKHKVKDVVVIGGGLIGLKTTEALIELGLHATVLELADRILSATFDAKASRLMTAYLKDKGVDVLTENTAEEILGEGGRVSGVRLRDGRELSCGMVVLAIGVKPNVSLTEGTGIKTNRGVIVDSRMQTSVPDVYAAGDVAEARDSLIGASRSIAIWPLAVRGGRVAGVSMAGGKAEYGGGYPMNSVEIHGLPTISVGITDPKEREYTIIEEYEPEKYVYRKVVLKDGRVRGVIFIGKIERAGLFTGLVNEGVDVGKIQDRLLGDGFGLITLPKDYRKHAVSGPGVEV